MPAEEIEAAIRFVEGLDIRAIAEQVMQELFQELAMHFEFSLAELAASTKQEEATTCSRGNAQTESEV